MNLYIVGPEDGGEGHYQLVTETGEPLAGHWCSYRGYAPGDLEGRRQERQQQWRERFGDYRVLWLGDDDLTDEELRWRNQVWYDAQETPTDE